MKKNGLNSIDPLYVIFEEHLLNFLDPEIDRKTFIVSIIAEYFKFLRNHNVTVPKQLEQPIVEELGAQINMMLLKKMYGCLTVEDFQKTVKPAVKKRAHSRYRKLTGVRAARVSR